ncbi:phasin family protein [Piscibacillus sp. B03]|uniref:phasin family protein n=1 Tax=Piscibacillus sp. B03 TaxID=3457430 RepID=UPI003FCE22F6
MRDYFNKGLSLGLGLASASKEQVNRVMDELIDKGELTKEESDHLLKELKRKGEQSQKQLDDKVKKQLKTYLDELEVPTKTDMEKLEERIRKLENQQSEER